jgi:DNA-binding NarL/FixJ family response regulator
MFGAVAREYSCPECRRPRLEVTVNNVSRELSFRERQIVGLVREAKANKEIAAELCLTEGTIKEYLHHIFRKLGVRNRTELALRREPAYECNPKLLREVG